MSSPEKKQWEKVNKELLSEERKKISQSRTGMQSEETARNNHFFHFFIAFDIVAFLVIVLIFSGVFNTKKEVATLTYEQAQLADQTEFWNSIDAMIKEQTKDNQKKGLSKSVFLGDSLTEGLGIYGYVKTGNVFAQKGLSIERSMKKVKKMAKKNPQNVFIMLGINDLNFANYSLDDVENNYRKLIKKIHKKMPNAHIYVESLLPVTAGYEKQNKRLSNKRIDKMNKRLKKLAKEYEYASYVNINKLYKNKKGKLSSKISSDGYHLTIGAYEKWIKCVKKEIKGK